MRHGTAIDAGDQQVGALLREARLRAVLSLVEFLTWANREL